MSELSLQIKINGFKLLISSQSYQINDASPETELHTAMFMVNSQWKTIIERLLLITCHCLAFVLFSCNTCTEVHNSVDLYVSKTAFMCSYSYFRPSTTQKANEDLSKDFLTAEFIGKSGGDCKQFYGNCTNSLLDFVSVVVHT